MTKDAVVFPGQGSQTVGMGKGFFDAYEEARAIYTIGAKVLGIDIAALCFEGPKEELLRTYNTQIALFTTEAAISAVLSAKGVKAAFTAGHSLGEYSALFHSGALGFEDGLRLVAARAQLMDQSTKETDGAMAAVIGLSAHTIDEVLSGITKGCVVRANQNSPVQTVISGDTASVDAACDALKNAGAKRCKHLAVSGAFHSPLMQHAADEFAKEIEQVEFRRPEIPVIPNTTATPVSEPDQIKFALIHQITSPVRWVETVQTMSAQGVGRCMEAGPGTVLKGLIRKTDDSLEVVSVHTVDDIPGEHAGGVS